MEELKWGKITFSYEEHENVGLAYDKATSEDANGKNLSN